MVKFALLFIAPKIGPTTSMPKKSDFVLIAIVLLLAIVVRVVAANAVPSSPYWEEVALGYDAYSLLTTGKDHHAHSWPILALESFGDWKPTGYVYAAIPSIAVLGLNTMAVRLPSLIAGLSLVICSMLVLRELIKATKVDPEHIRNLSWMTGLIAALSPWGILLSRAAWETNLATALAAWSVYATFRAFDVHQKRPTLWYLGAVLLTVGSVYTYHATRVSAPLLLGLSTIAAWQLSSARLKKWLGTHWHSIAIGALCFTVCAAPLYLSYVTGSTTGHRIAETSIFSDIDTITLSNQRKAEAGNSLISRIIYHRYVLFGARMLANAASHFSPAFLFVSGDVNVRHSTGFGGQLLPFDAVLLAVGSWYLWKNARKQGLFLVLWLVIAVLPASITVAVPHALRSSLMLPSFVMIAGLGLWQIYCSLHRLLPKFKSIVAPSLLIAYSFQFVPFWLQYMTVYPSHTAHEWQYGYQQIVTQLQQARDAYPDHPVYFTREQGRPAMYYWFFTQTNPELVQQEVGVVELDQGEFLSFQNISFVRGTYEIKQVPALIVSSPSFLEEYRAQHPTAQIRTLSQVPDRPATTDKHVWSLSLLESEGK